MKTYEEMEQERRISEAAVTVDGEVEIGREYSPDFQREKVVKTILDDVEEVSLGDNSPHVFRPPGRFQFLSPKHAVQFKINKLVEESRQEESLQVEGLVREKTAAECGAEIQQVIAAVEADLVSKLAMVLQRPGPWRDAVVSSENSIGKNELLERGREDLLNRLRDVHPSLLFLWLVSQVKPEVFRKAIETLPAGQSEDDIRREWREAVERDRESRRRKIEEGRAFLKKLKWRCDEEEADHR